MSLVRLQADQGPAKSRPLTDTFTQTGSLQANGERVDLGYLPPAHTDADIYIHDTRGNVLHLGETFFNGVYPLIDASTGGSINGAAQEEDGLEDRSRPLF